METYSQVPAQFVIGDTLQIEIAGGEYPAPDYALQLILISPDNKLSVDSTADGSDHLLTVDTSTMLPGRYDYQLKVIGDSYRATITTGYTIAKQDFSDADLTTLDNRDWLEITIDALESAIAGRASKTQLVREFDGVRIQDMTLDEQIEALNKFKRMQLGRSGSWRKTIIPRFYN